MTPPICGKCGARHWSSQPCGKDSKPAKHRAMTSNAPVTERNADVTKRDVTERNDALHAVTELTKRMDLWDGLFKGAMQCLDKLERRVELLTDRVTDLESQREEDEAQARIAEGGAPITNGPQRQGPMTNAERQRAYRDRKKQANA